MKIEIFPLGYLCQELCDLGEPVDDLLHIVFCFHFDLAFDCPHRGSTRTNPTNEIPASAQMPDLVVYASFAFRCELF